VRITARGGIFLGAGRVDEAPAFQTAGWWWHSSPEDCRAGPRTCPACVQGIRRLWWTRKPESAVRLSAYADDRALAALANHMRAVEMSRATDADIEIPIPPELVRRGWSYKGYQKAGIAYMAKRESTLLGDAPGLGKAQPLEAKILTPAGWVRMGNMKVGHPIINLAGGISHVTGIFPQGTKKIYRLHFQDGSSTECCNDHLWGVNTSDRRSRGYSLKILPLKKIRSLPLTDPSGKRRHFIPTVPSHIDLGPKPESIIDPYLLGYLLGNGGLSQKAARLSVPDQETVDRLSRLLPQGMRLSHQDKYDWLIVSDGDGWTPNPIINELRRLELMGHRTEEKFIPHMFMWAPAETRIAVLQGLLDSDAHVRPVDNNIEYSTVSKRLAHDFRFLVWSLGGNARIRPKKTHYTVDGQRIPGQLSYRMSVALPDDIKPFRLRRKASVYHPRPKYKPYRAIARIEYVGKKQAQCIAVDSADSLYITDDFIVTHNTIQSIGLINLKQDIKSVIIICPASLRLNWLREARTWLVKDGRNWRFHVVNEDESISPDVNFIIVNYNRIVVNLTPCKDCGGEVKKPFPCPACDGTGNGAVANELCGNCNGKKTVFCSTCKGKGKLPGSNIKIVESLWKRKYDLLVVDEAHAIKNPRARRTRAILGDRFHKKEGLAEFSRQKIFLTGTPMPNRPIEMWPLLSILAPREFGNLRRFALRYCDGREEWVSKTKKVFKADGASNLPELQEKLRSTVMIRRLKEDVLKDLPPKQRQIISLMPTETAKRLIAEELEIWDKQFGEEMDLIREATEAAKEQGGEESEIYNSAVQRLKYIQGVAFMEMARVRKEVAIAKLPNVIEHLTNLWEEGTDKIVCFAHHKEVIRALQEKFEKKSVVLFGETSMKDRQAAVDRFQEDGKTKLFIGGIMAAGTGITLTASSTAVFAELDWTPANVLQAEDRLHRIGQSNSVLVQHLVLDGSLDARMAQMIVEKQDLADRALDKSTDVSIRGILELRPEAPAPPLPLWQKIAIQAAMVTLAQRRDPKEEGSHGFSSFDATIGQKLATWKGTYSDKQAHLALKLAKKYRRQLPDDLQRQLGIYEEPKANEKRRMTANKRLIGPEDKDPNILQLALGFVPSKAS